MAILDDLSAELVDLISSYICCPNSFCNFRETSRACYERTRTEYNRRVCNLGFINAPHSLEILRDISGHSKFASKIKALRLGVHCAGQQQHVDNLRDDAKWLNDPDERAWARDALVRYKAYAAAAARFRQGDDVATMTLIMSRLSALDTVEIGEWYDSHDELRFYGQTTYERDTGESYLRVEPPEIIETDNGIDHLTHTFCAVLRAIRISQKHIRHLRVHQLDPRWSDYYALALSQLPRLDEYYLSGLKDPLHGLTTLDLAISFESPTLPTSLTLEWLPKFLILTPNLKKLALTSDGYEDLEINGLPLQHPSSAMGFQGLAAVVQLPRLTSLSLELFGVHVSDFLTFFQKHMHIRDIKLRQVGLIGGTWNEAISSAFQGCHLPDGWNLTLAWAEQFLGVSPGSDYVVFDELNSQECSECYNLATFEMGATGYIDQDCHHATAKLLPKDIEKLELRIVSTQAMTRSYTSRT